MADHSPTPRRLRALVAVARAYNLAPRELADGVWFCHCPGCPSGAQGRSLALCATPTGAHYLCRLCGVHGARLDVLSRLAEGAANDDTPPPSVADPRATLRAELAEIGARHGDRGRSAMAAAALAYAAAGELAEAENLEIGPNGTTRHGPPGLRIVQAANDDTPAPDLDVCRCPSCEGRDDRGEGDA